MGGSGKRKRADGSHVPRNTSGKLRRLRLPLPPSGPPPILNPQKNLPNVNSLTAGASVDTKGS